MGDWSALSPWRSGRQLFLTATGVVFAVAMVVTVAALAALFLLFTGHRWARAAAVIVGFPSAVAFTVVHLVPDWGPLSDAFPDAHGADVTTFSWFAAPFEIGAGLAFGAAGVVTLLGGHRARRRTLESATRLAGSP